MTSGFIQRIRSPPCVSSGAVRSSQRRIRLALIGAAHATAATAYRIMPFTTKSQGLGLVISREIANKMGRELLFYASDTGASFTVSLNRAPTTRGSDPVHDRSDAAGV